MKQKQSQSILRERFYTRDGFALVEVILAVALFGLLATGFIGSLIYGQQVSALTGSRMRAVNIAKEGIEAVRNIRDNDFSALSAGTYGLSSDGNTWSLSGNSDETDGFERQVVIEEIDSDRWQITAEITWEQNQQRQGNIQVDTYLTNWQRQAGGQGSGVNADSSGASVCCGNKQIRDITLTNDGDEAVTLTAMTTSWTDASTELEQIQIDSSIVWPPSGPSPSGTSGTQFDITDVDIDPGATATVDFLKFDSSILDNTVDIIFHLSDGSTQSLSIST